MTKPQIVKAIRLSAKKLGRDPTSATSASSGGVWKQAQIWAA